MIGFKWLQCEISSLNEAVKKRDTFSLYLHGKSLLLNLSEEQILTLAPDESSKKSGKDLANSAKWVSKGANEQSLWGECQGSGSKPYQTQVDIANMAFKCSCPSRKFPCKHGLGLLLLFAREKNSFTVSTAPAWVTEWLNKRSERQEKQAEKNDKPADEAAQAKRQQARQSKVNDGIEELNTWLKDIVRNGIISIPEKGPAFFANMVRRLVDAQAPGLAGMVRILGETNFYTEGWPTRFMDQLMRIYLVTEGFKNSESLDESLKQDIRTSIGFAQNQDELKKQTGITDTWLVLGKQSSEVDSITTERYWLYGTQSDSYALLLQFIVRGQGVQFNLTPGMFVRAELVFFSSALPLRALIKQQIAVEPVSRVNKFDNWQKVIETETELNSRLPFRNERPYIVHQLKPVPYNKEWWLIDVDNRIMQVDNEFKNIWKLLSLSGGQAMDMAVIAKENRYEPIGVWQGDEYKII
ncbi:MAG: SWIM zinc finger family protein [Bacteroidota bacterium]|nr:SWIM zinc finger family protein [Bacteroidota bacterium]